MKTVDVTHSDISVIQPLLDQQFGPGVFVIDRTINESIQWKEYFLKYDDNLPQTLVDEAVQLVNGRNTEILNELKIQWYSKIQEKVTQKINDLAVFKFTQQEISSAQNWLNNTSDPVPGCVSFIALKNGLTTIQAAEYIANGDTNYQNLINQLNSILTNFQNTIMTSDMRECRMLIKQTNLQIINFPN